MLRGRGIEGRVVSCRQTCRLCMFEYVVAVMYGASVAGTHCERISDSSKKGYENNYCLLQRAEAEGPCLKVCGIKKFDGCLLLTSNVIYCEVNVN